MKRWGNVISDVTVANTNLDHVHETLFSKPNGVRLCVTCIERQFTEHILNQVYRAHITIPDV